MAKLTATASKVITKAAGRKATVVAPAFPLRLKGQQKWFKKYWAAKVNRKSMASYVDVVSVNLYPAGEPGTGSVHEAARLSRRRPCPRPLARSPMWNTEINYGLLGGATAKTISDAKQAAFVARTLLLNAASAIRRVYWYSWAQGPIANTHLVQDDRTTLTRGGRAWQLTAGWIAGTNMKKCVPAAKGKSKGLYTCIARVRPHGSSSLLLEAVGQGGEDQDSWIDDGLDRLERQCDRAHGAVHHQGRAVADPGDLAKLIDSASAVAS